jgi:ADP-ribose pyrophosphatase
MEMKEKQMNSKLIYKGKIVNLYVDQVICPNGNEATREVIRHCKAVAVIASIGNKFIMEKQFRYPYNTELIEIPAGKVDPNEDLEKACIRELEEETGYLARKLVYLGTIYPTVAFCDEEISIYYASDLVKTNTHPDEDEFVEVYFDTLDNIMNQIKNGIIKDSKTICGFNYYLLNKENL